MSYHDSEISVASGQPVELYNFTMENSPLAWRYVSAAYNVVYDGNTYEARPGLHRGEIEDDDDAFSSELSVYLPPDDPLVYQYMFASPDNNIQLILYRAHGDDFQRYWTGVIKACLPIDGEEAVITLKSMMANLDYPCQYLKFCRICSIMLFSELCGVDKIPFAVTGSVAEISGNQVTAVAFAYYADAWFNGGWLYGNGRRRKIDRHFGDYVILNGVIPGLAAGMAITAYPGCDHTYTTCAQKFGNGLDFKGYPWIVDDNPYLERVF